MKVKVKQSHYRPGEVLRVPGGWGFQISRQSTHTDGKVVSPTHRPPLRPRKYSWYSFLLEAESTVVRTEGLCHWKTPMTISGIEPATFRLVAQCLNQLQHPVPQRDEEGNEIRNKQKKTGSSISINIERSEGKKGRRRERESNQRRGTRNVRESNEGTDDRSY